MPRTNVLLYKEENNIPMLNWLEEVKRTDRKAFEKCIAQMKLLKNYGYELHRPYADYLKNGIYELRISFRHIQYRILYFFHGKNVIILSHGLIKERKVLDVEINKAIERKLKYENDPESHTYEKGV